MTRVVDASVACKWFFDEPLSDQALVLAAAHRIRLAPDPIVTECANVAWRRVRDEQVPLGQDEAFLEVLPAWFERLMPSVRLHETAFRVARRLSHPVYDCLYERNSERRQMHDRISVLDTCVPGFRSAEEPPEVGSAVPWR